MPAGLDTAHRTAARVAAIRAPYPGTDTLTPRTGPHAGNGGAAAEVLAPVVHLADRSPRPAHDGAALHAHAPRIDAQNRINLGKALGTLGWTEQTLLVAARDNGHVVIRAAADSRLLTRVPVDADRRLTLPPAVLVALDVRPGGPGAGRKPRPDAPDGPGDHGQARTEPHRRPRAAPTGPPPTRSAAARTVSRARPQDRRAWGCRRWT